MLGTLKNQLTQIQIDIGSKDAQLKAQAVLIENLNAVIKLIEDKKSVLPKQI